MPNFPQVTPAPGSTNFAGLGETVGTVIGTDLALTVNTDGVSILYPKWLTTAALSGDTTKYAGVGESVGTVIGTDLAMTVNTDGVSILYPKWITTQTVQTQNAVDITLGGNTSGVLALISSGTATIAGGNNITLNQSGNAVTISAFNQTVESQSLGMSNLGNTRDRKSVV